MTIENDKSNIEPMRYFEKFEILQKYLINFFSFKRIHLFGPKYESLLFDCCLIVGTRVDGSEIRVNTSSGEDKGFERKGAKDSESFSFIREQFKQTEEPRYEQLSKVSHHRSLLAEFIYFKSHLKQLPVSYALQRFFFTPLVMSYRKNSFALSCANISRGYWADECGWKWKRPYFPDGNSA